MVAIVDYSTSLDYFVTVIAVIATLCSVPATIYSVYKVYLKSSTLNIIAVTFMAVNLLAQLVDFIYFFVNADYGILSAAAVLIILDSFVFLLAQTETIQLVCESRKRAVSLMYRWKIVHVVMHVVFGLPNYTINTIFRYAAPQLYKSANPILGGMLVIWTLYTYSFDIGNSIWISRKLHQLSLHIAAMKKKGHATANNTDSKASATEQKILMKRAESFAKDDPAAAIDKYYVKTMALLAGLAIIDVLGVVSICMIAVLATKDSAEMLHMRSLLQYLALLLSSIHVSGAVVIYSLLAAIFSARTG